MLQSLPIPTQVLSDISMNFIGGLPKVQGKDIISIVVDKFSKYAHFLALVHPYIARDVTQLFVRKVVNFHGFPSPLSI